MDRRISDHTKTTETIKEKEKRVELIELFYDLIYVYAISRLTLLIEEPVNGIIPPAGFFRYIVVCFVILQGWLYLTNYVNRYGRWQWYEYGLTAINMVSAIYMANTISNQWEEMATTFNVSMLVMLLCVGAMYLIQVWLKEQDPAAARNSLQILTVDCILYLSAFLASLFQLGHMVIWIDVAAVLIGAFLPFFVRGRFDSHIIHFPHLAERFELITIISFGEGIVGMTDYFDVHNFTLRPVLVFTVILLLFGSYVLQIHYLCDHHRVDRALRLMLTHYFVVIAVNLITVAFKFLENSMADRLLTAILMITAMGLYYVSIFENSSYYYEGSVLERKDKLLSLCSFTVGALCMIFGRSITNVFLLGAFIVTCGNFCMLYQKYKKENLDR